MLQLLRDKLSTARLRARYENIVHQRLIQLTETERPQPVSPDPDDWALLGQTKSNRTESQQQSTRDRARSLVRENPYAANVLRLLQAYVTGPGLSLSHLSKAPHQQLPQMERMLETANQMWLSFLQHNANHYSFQEHASRTWRDGECFVRKFSSDAWPPVVRFVDPESIASTAQAPTSQGILTDPYDVETPVAYLRHTSATNDDAEQIPAADIIQTRIGVDSNEKRGVSLFAPIIEPLTCFSRWMETELMARKLQSSIVLWRKVQGSPQMAESFAEQAATGAALGGVRRERFAPGTIITTNHGTDIQFLQPNTNFGDAASLGRMLLLSVAAGAGLPEFMLTSDASNANFASTMVAEGPAVKFFQSQQQFFAAQFERVWRWVMQEAIDQQLLPAEFFELIEVKWSFPPLVNRDRPRERMADVRLVDSGILSRAEVARRDGVDPATMAREVTEESQAK